MIDQRLHWKRSARSAHNGNCVEVACVHDAPWRKSSRSGHNGNCVEVAPVRATIALRDSKLDTTGDFPFLAVDGDDWAGLVATIRTDDLDG